MAKDYVMKNVKNKLKLKEYQFDLSSSIKQDCKNLISEYEYAGKSSKRSHEVEAYLLYRLRIRPYLDWRRKEAFYNCLYYLKEMIQNRWTALEEIIKIEDEPWEYAPYAAAVGKPIPEFEKTIAKYANTSFQYATEALHGPFPAGEPKMKTFPEIWKIYQKKFQKKKVKTQKG